MSSSLDILTPFNILRKEAEKWETPIVELIEVQTKDPFKVLLATVLSARTKDEVTAKASARLFTKVNTPDDLVNIDVSEIAKLIYPVGFYKTKAKHLQALGKMLIEKFNRAVPQSMDELLMLPGVGRKTANLVLAVGFQIPALCIDTHCHRIPQRLGWLTSKTPYESEMKLRELLPKNIWLDFNWVFVSFGQSLCRPIGPKCSRCPISSHCKYYKEEYVKNN